MVLLIDGKKSTPEELRNGLDSFIRMHPQLEKWSMEFLAQEEKHHPEEDLVYVSQRELAVAHSSDPAVKVLGSEDATTCHVVLLHHRQSDVFGLAHFDDGSGIQVVADEILKLAKDHITSHSRLSNEFDLKIATSYNDERGTGQRDSMLLLTDCMKHQEYVFHLRLCNCGYLNTISKNVPPRWPRVYGASVDLRTGTFSPASFSSHGPDELIRGIRIGRALPPQKRDLTAMYNPRTHRFVIELFSLRRLSANMTEWHEEMAERTPDAELLRICSTSPAVEPPSFLPQMRSQFRFFVENAKNPTAAAFPDGVARVYQRNSNGKWEMCTGE